MNARIRFAISVIILGLLMTGPFVITALLIWAGAKGPSGQCSCS
jgi:DNA polymerase-3 subunit epsilon